MQVNQRVQIISLFGVSLLVVPLLQRMMGQSETGARGNVRRASPSAAGTASAAARQEAWRCWLRAEARVNQERDQLEAWDPEASGTAGWVGVCDQARIFGRGTS